MKFLVKYLYQASRMLWLLLKPMSVGVRILLVTDRQVVLVKHVYEPYWYLPGGAVERNETLDQAVRREALEEAGAVLQDLQLFGVFTHFEHGKCDHIAVFLSQSFELTCEGDDEIEACRLFSLDDLPDPLSKGSANRIQEFLDGKTGTFGAW